MDSLRPFLSRLLSPFVAAFAGYLAIHFGVNLDTDNQVVLVKALVEWIIPLMVAVNALVHRALDKWLNPGDAASSHVAKQEAAQASALKTAERNKRV